MTTYIVGRKDFSKYDGLISKVEKVIKNGAVRENMSGALKVDVRRAFVSIDDNLRALEQLQSLKKRHAEVRVPRTDTCLLKKNESET